MHHTQKYKNRSTKYLNLKPLFFLIHLPSSNPKVAMTREMQKAESWIKN